VIGIWDLLCYVRVVSDFERQFSNAIESAERAVFIELIRDNPQLSLAEIAKLGKGRFEGLLSSVTVGDIMGASKGRRGGRRAEGRAVRGGKKHVDTRTRAGRDAYDEAILGVLQNASRPLRAPEITGEVGGSPLQARASLARLIDAGRVTWEGKARGTKYSIA
jgi:hypothetical protein